MALQRGLITAVMAVFLAGTAGALPRFSAKTGSKCQSCHVNPSGGGMRQAFGAQYGREELPVPGWSEGLEIEDVTTALTNALGVGADFRTLFVARSVPDSTGAATRTENAFWQMQGDLYLNFRISRKVHLYLKKGLYSGFEVFGALHVLPMNGHVKVGKFVPDYGLKLDDHTAFIRTYTGFSPATGRPEITGLEAALSPGPARIAAGFYNATDAFGGGDSRKAFLGRAEGLFGVGGDAHLGIGANVFHRESASGLSTTLLGSFGSFGVGGLTILGEVDLIRQKAGGTTVSGLVAFGEADYTLVDGLDLKFMYDFYDPDRDKRSGAVSRFSVGFEFFPLSGVEVRPLYRIVKDEPQDIANNEVHILFHLYL